MSPITIHIKDKSNAWNGLYAEQGGKRVPVEQALRCGFCISSDDAPMVVTLLDTWIRTREVNQQ